MEIKQLDRAAEIILQSMEDLHKSNLDECDSENYVVLAKLAAALARIHDAIREY